MVCTLDLSSSMPTGLLQGDWNGWKSTLKQCKSSDPILECPSSVTSLLDARPFVLIKIAHSKIHSFQYDQVPLCWRRLYTDASVWAAIQILENFDLTEIELRGDGDSVEEASHDARKPSRDIDEIVRLLDMAKIIAGAPEREDMIEDILTKLQTAREDADDRSPSRKRRKVDPVYFPAIGLKIPRIDHELERLQSPSLGEFETRLRAGLPLLVTDSLSHWPAFGEHPWRSPSYLLRRTLGGRRLIPVELGRSYTDTGWGQSIMRFKDFMDQYLLNSPGDDETNIAYLAQHDLFTQIPDLRNDISIPDYCYTDPPSAAPGTPLAAKPALQKLDEPLLNAWFGPAGTVSPLHTDPYHNILCQVVGRKYVRLYSPHETEKLYPRKVGQDGVDMSNTSLVDAEGDGRKIKEEYPSFLDAKYFETILDQGEALYVPVGWWHYVRSLDVSFSVSFWWN